MRTPDSGVWNSHYSITPLLHYSITPPRLTILALWYNSSAMGLVDGISLLWLLLLVPVIVFLYLLKLKRRSVTVSSVLLWSRLLKDVQANSPFQKLRRNLLLLLQLLIVALAIFALARPFLRV